MKLYDSLQSSPLFQGLTSDNLLQIIGQTKFTFRKIAAGDIIKKEGEQCNRLALVVNGQAKSIAYADDHGYSIEENVAAPYTLQPECMFGLQLHYTRTFIATTTCDIVEIDKDDLMRISDEFIIFRMNLGSVTKDHTQTMAPHTSRRTRPDSTLHQDTLLIAHRTQNNANQNDTPCTRNRTGQTCRVGNSQHNARRKPANIQPRNNRNKSYRSTNII